MIGNLQGKKIPSKVITTPLRKHYNPQTPRYHTQKCRLMNLPQEIRLKILRNVMRSPQPLKSPSLLRQLSAKKDEANAGEVYKDSLKLSSQVLRICRKLKEEGELILYGENILAIFYESGHSFKPLSQIGPENAPANMCSIFHVVFPLPESHFHSKTCELSLYDFAKAKCLGLSRAGNIADELLKIYDRVARFRRVQLIVGKAVQSDGVPLQSAVLWFRELLRDKDVELMCLRQRTTLPISTDKPYLERPLFIDFSACRALQCRSFKITNSKRDPSQLAYLRSIEHSVTSREPKIDLIGDLLQFYSELGSLPDMNPFWEGSTAQTTELGNCAWDYDVEEYTLIKVELVKAVKEHIHSRLAPRIEHLARELDKVRKEDEALMDKINNMGIVGP